MKSLIGNALRNSSLTGICNIIGGLGWAVWFYGVCVFAFQIWVGPSLSLIFSIEFIKPHNFS